MDTPARAARVERPCTRAWKQLIVDASNRTTESATHRARLRAHLAAADRLAAKRAALVSARPSSVTLSDEQPAIEKEQADQSLSLTLTDTAQPAFSPSAEWFEQVSTFAEFTEAPSSNKCPAIAVVLPDALRSLRSKVVLAASDAAVAAAPFLTSAERKTVFSAASTGTTVAKKIIADSCHRAALAVLKDCDDSSVWRHVISTITDDHVSCRELVVNAVSQLVDDRSTAHTSFVTAAATEVLSAASVDKQLQVRDAARALVSQFRTRFGDAEADALLETLPSDVRIRFLKPSSSLQQKSESTSVKFGESMKRKPGTNIRDMIKARRAALKKCKPDDNVIKSEDTQGVENDSTSGNIFEIQGAENANPCLIASALQ